MKNEKLIKIGNVIINVICIIIMFFVLSLTISTLVAPDGMSSFYGFGYLAVETNSMDGDKEDNFRSGDVIYVDILSDKERGIIKEGDIVVFLDNINGKIAYNTHRIVEIREDTDGTKLYFTKGDNNELIDATPKRADQLIASYVGQSKNFGKAILWMQSKTGFIVCVAIPGALVVIYSIVIVILSIRTYSKSKLAKHAEDIKASFDEEMKEQLRKELLEELKAEKVENSNNNTKG